MTCDSAENIELTAYSDSDALLIHELTEEKYYRIFITYPKDTIKAIKRNGNIVGWAHLDVPENTLYAGFVLIYIVPEYRRQGIATIVYKRLEKELEKSCTNWWSSYPESEIADRFALAVGFDYTNTNSYLLHNGRLCGAATDGIRKCRIEDYPQAPDIWSQEYADMHIRIGLPYEKKERSDEEKAQEFLDFQEHINDCFVMETDGKIIGFGQIFSDHSGIGALAIDKKYAGQGYGTHLAAFLTNECIRRGCRTPCLYCESGNDDALHIYHKLGYAEQSRESVANKRKRNKEEKP